MRLSQLWQHIVFIRDHATRMVNFWGIKISVAIVGTLPLLLSKRIGVHIKLVAIAAISTYHEVISEFLNWEGIEISSLNNQGLHSSILCLAREVFVEVLFALDSAISDFADFLWVESLPWLSIEVLIKRNNEERVNKVDKGISDITVVLQVNWEVKEIIAAGMELINLLKEHLLGVLVGDVSNHDRCARILSMQYAIKINLESIIITLIDFSLIIENLHILVLIAQQLLLLIFHAFWSTIAIEARRYEPTSHHVILAHLLKGWMEGLGLDERVVLWSKEVMINICCLVHFSKFYFSLVTKFRVMELLVR